jgi:signal transduction histidine kinase/DNA-binding response OmpR family regulator
MNENMLLRAALYDDVELTIHEARGDLNKQIADIQRMIDDGTDVIVVSPLYVNKLDDVIHRAHSKGIPIILVDRRIESDQYTLFVGADNIEVGRIAANYILNNSKGETRVIELKGWDGSSAAHERNLGFNHVLDEYPRVQVTTVTGDSSGIIMRSIKEAYSIQENDVDFVFGFNDELTALGRDAARELGIEEQIQFIGVDGLIGPDGGIERVLNGEFAATILYPTGGSEVINLARRIAKGETLAKRYVLKTTVIDRFNADIMKDQFHRIKGQQSEIQQQVEAIQRQEELYSAQNSLLKVTVTLLLVIFSLAIYGVYSMMTIRKKNRELVKRNRKITAQRNEIEQIAQEAKISNEAKVNFFTGLSHEFKTPITLIMSSIESIRDQLNGSSVEWKQELELINNNSNRLLRLINNLLDFRKIEDKKFNLRASNTSIFHFSSRILDEFRREAQKRRIDLRLETNNKELYLFIDRNLMDKVYFNLLSNAFKFTPDGGTIQVEILDHLESNSVQIVFRDSGIGIPESELPKVFEPFFKGSNNRKNSSGIGLNLTREFVELHLGRISVSSDNGTEFTIELFKGSTHFNEDQIVNEPDILNEQTLEGDAELTGEDPSQVISDISIWDAKLEPADVSKDKEKTEDRPSILIIEDNIDLTTFMRTKLSSTYEVITSDGTDGIELAFEHIPDVVICDVNLPEKDGFEICQTLKGDIRTSHIPTIILTALNDSDSYLMGLKSGADLYLTKPFSFSILFQSIKTLLYNRERIRSHYGQDPFPSDSQTPESGVDQKFIAKLKEELIRNLDNTELTVEMLAETIGISRVQLYRKVKALLGIGVNDLIIRYRLDKSAELLQNPDLTISEVAYSCGFSSPNYFSTTFKAKFQTTPAKYRKNLLAESEGDNS